MSIEEMKQHADRAVGVFSDVNLFPAVRVGGAHEYLVALVPERDTLPALLRGQFDELWAAFGVSVPPGPSAPAHRGRFAHMSDEQIARCERLTREFATSLAMYLPEAAEAAEDESAPQTEDTAENGRAAADD